MKNAIVWPGICFCGRRGAGFFYTKPGDPAAKTIACCSTECLENANRRKGDMTLTDDEYDSILAASPVAGEHIEAIGKTDFAIFTEEEWLDFLAAVYEAVSTENQRKWTLKDGVPF